MISRHAGKQLHHCHSGIHGSHSASGFSKTTGPGPKVASNSCASNAVDAQAAYESQMSIWSSAMAHASLVYHGAGWMEGGLTASFEEIVLDVEMLQMMAETIQPFAVAPETLDAIASFPGGHFFGAAHTLNATRLPSTARCCPTGAYESWQIDGAMMRPSAPPRFNRR
jgi:trimethylamine--corrinoid protein Co-methyltransferase